MKDVERQTNRQQHMGELDRLESQALEQAIQGVDPKIGVLEVAQHAEIGEDRQIEPEATSLLHGRHIYIVHQDDRMRIAHGQHGQRHRRGSRVRVEREVP